MRLIFAVLLLSIVASAQSVTECAGNVCVGTDGQGVNLGGNAIVTRVTVYQGDGGAGPALTRNVDRLVPGQSATTFEWLGNQARTSTNADIVVGGINARDGGVPVFQVITGSNTLFSVGANGAVTSPGIKVGSVACDGGTPSPTVTVRAGATCVCNRTDTAAKCSVSSTTLTINCVAADVTSLQYICL